MSQVAVAPPARVLLPAPIRAAMEAMARAAYPAEACGLLVGTGRADGAATIERLEPSLNRAGHADRFEIDIILHLRLQRELRGSGQHILGVWHSHPDHPPEPSASDAAGADEAGFLWLITAVTAGVAGATRAYLAQGKGAGFTPLPLAADDAAPAANAADGAGALR
ncbi:MAG: M67 family metallopeptidase [Alphaproteobacteria bacterium]|nr:M67 family metallopeptidase [Alphaproteobacteria bacterium]